MRFFLCLFYMFHRRYSNCRPLNSARYNRVICQTVENTTFFERLSCILNALAKGYQGYKSSFGFHVPFDREKEHTLWLLSLNSLILFKMSLQFFLPQFIPCWDSEKILDTPVQRCLWHGMGGGGGWGLAGVNWKSPINAKVPQDICP